MDQVTLICNFQKWNNQSLVDELKWTKKCMLKDCVRRHLAPEWKSLSQSGAHLSGLSLSCETLTSVRGFFCQCDLTDTLFEHIWELGGKNIIVFKFFKKALYSLKTMHHECTAPFLKRLRSFRCVSSTQLIQLLPQHIKVLQKAFWWTIIWLRCIKPGKKKLKHAGYRFLKADFVHHCHTWLPLSQPHTHTLMDTMLLSLLFRKQLLIMLSACLVHVAHWECFKYTKSISRKVSK